MASGSEDVTTQPNPADKLTEDPLVEILSRLPYKSLCRFKCVSRQWRNIISHPEHRKVLAQYHLNFLAGFFFWTEDCEYDHDHPSRFLHNFTAVSVGGRPHIDPSLPFLRNLVAVDVEGTTWRMIPMPHDENPPFIYDDIGSIHLSQGRLYLANTDDFDLSKLSIWVLEDYGSEVRILKHNVMCLNLFGLNYVEFRDDYNIVAIHPEQGTIFLVYGHDKVLMSYEMDSGKVQFIHDLGHDSLVPYIPYAPLYSESLADGCW
ncbi:unnamed protein product [Alopecurus aequalis]